MTKKPGLGPGFSGTIVRLAGRLLAVVVVRAARSGGRGPRGRAGGLPRSCGRTGLPRRCRCVADAAAAGVASSGTVSASGSSTSTYFCIEWMSCSLRSSGAIVSSAISRRATTGFLSRSRSMVSGEPDGDQAGAVAGEQDELEAVVDLVDAVFDGHTSHAAAPSRVRNSGRAPDTPDGGIQEEACACGGLSYRMKGCTRSPHAWRRRDR